MRKETQENMLLFTSAFLKQKEYWLEKLSRDINETGTGLPEKKVSTIPEERTAEKVKITFSPDLSKKLLKLSKQSDLSLYIILLAGLKSLLHRYTDNEDIIVTSPLHLARISKQTINSRLFIRDIVRGEMTFKELILHIRKSVLDAYENQDYPFDRLMELLFDASAAPVKFLSSIACCLKNIHGEKNIQEIHLASKISFSFSREEEQVSGDIVFDSSSYEKYYLERTAEHFLHLLDNAVPDVGITIARIPFLPEQEKQRLLVEFNRTWQGYPLENTLHRLFEEQVGKTPENTALLGHSLESGRRLSLSYKDLNEKANALALRLRKKGVKPDTIVGLLMDRSSEMIVTILAILKAGGAYLPIESEFPNARIKYMLKDTCTRLLLTEKKYMDKAGSGIEIILIEPGEIDKGNEKNLPAVGKPGDIAYIIYTSGTTGKPKGVMATHFNVIRVVKNTNYIDLNQDDRVLQLSNYAFDGSVFDIYGALLNGALLVMIQRETLLQVDHLSELIKNKKITVFFVTTALFNALVDVKLDCFAGIKKVLFGGERVSVDHSRRALAYSGKDRIIHVYGPTETTVYASYYFIRQIPAAAVTVPIGKPISSTFLYILDKYLNPVPVGINGEIYIGGTGTARGYLNSTEFTCDKFIKNPFREGDRLYRTGDLARWLPQGNIEFLGRVDHQVKLRGYRIELGEIESRLQKHQRIKDAVVIVTERGKEKNPVEISNVKTSENRYENRDLCAYIALDDHKSEPLSLTELREHLSKELPDYMIPSHFIMVEGFTLTANGKIDRKNLPDPQAAALQSSVEYVAPRSAVELELVEICNNVLNREITSVTDNFFEIGGDSIRAIQIASRMHQAGYKIDVADIFQYSVIAELAQRVKKVQKTAAQSPVTGVVQLTPQQIAFFDRAGIHPHQFNQAVLLHFEEKIDPQAIKTVLTKIQEHHDGLRRIFQIKQGEVIQTNQGLDYPLALDIYNYQHQQTASALEAMAKKIENLRASFQLETGPLMKAALFHLADGDRLLIVIHRLVIDAVSWRILLEDIGNLYRLYKSEDRLILPLKTGAGKIWAEKLQEYANSEACLAEIPYWRELESRQTPPLNPDFPAKDKDVKDIRMTGFGLNEAETNLLLTQVHHAFTTEITDILLTALGLAIKKTFGNRHLAVALESDGRGHPHLMDISRTVGWFASTYPVRLDLSYENEPDWDWQIIEIKESLRQTPHQGIGYGILKYLTAKEHKKELNFKLKPKIRFRYLEPLSINEEQMPFKAADRLAEHPEAPNRQTEYQLDVYGTITDERLHITITYNHKQYRTATLQKFANHYQAYLKALIFFCCHREKKELTPSDLTYKKLSIDELAGLKEHYSDQIEDIYGLTPLQEGMLFHSIYQTQGSTNFVQLAYRLQGQMEPVLMRQSLNELFKRHDILRTAFVYEGFDRPLQVVLKNRQVDFHIKDIRQTAAEHEKEKWVEEFIENDRNSFNLAEDILMRITVIQANDGIYEFIWSFHHILMDGWCLGVLIQEFFEIYNCFRENQPARLAPVTPYRTYIQWLEQRDQKESKRYWANYLADYQEMVGIPRTKPVRTGETGYRSEQVLLEIDQKKTASLNRLAGKNHVTLNTVVRAIWGVILGEYNYKRDVVFGVVVSGRPSELPGVETIIGLFINTIPLRIRHQDHTTFKQLLQRIQKDAVQSEPHHYYPLAGIQAESPLKQNLLDHILVFENYPLNEQMNEIMATDDIQAQQEKNQLFQASRFREFSQTNYDLNVSIGPGDRILVNFDYNGNVYQKELMEQIAGNFERIVQQVIADEEIKVENITLLSRQEKEKILLEFNQTRRSYPQNKTIHELFAEQAEHTPHHIAVLETRQLHEEETKAAVPLSALISITYKELNQRAHHLARLLIQKGTQPDTIVGIMVKRSIDMVIGLLSILKAGSAYLPIDPEYPQERIRYMLEDSSAKFLVTDSWLSEIFEKLSIVNCQLLIVNEMPPNRRRLNNPPQEAIPHLHLSPAPVTSLAYVLYTSGSTGKPKGVLVEHRSAARLVMNCNYIDLTPGDRLLLTGSMVFDITTFEIWGSLLNGLTLYLAPQALILDREKLNSILTKHRINILHLVPQLFNQLAAADPQGLNLFAHLDYFLVGGDLVRPGHVNKVRNKIKNLNILHMYGPTENTTFSTFYPVDREFDNAIPIGKPISNSSAYVVGPYGNLQPIGAVGELYVGGPGVARGYLNRPELTFDKFINDNWSDRSNRSYKSYKSYMLYKTGDLARWLPDGNIQFLGRRDQQIKIRGIRIELGEIENELLKHQDIKEAVVINRESGTGEKYLYAYIVLKPHHKINELEEELREHLSHSLPDYMVPTYFIQLDEMPLNPNGKIQRSALPHPRADTGKERTPPRNELEKKLVKIWSEILSREESRIGIDDNFFQLGGHSLKATTLVSRIKKDFKIDVPMTELFKKTSIRLLAEYIGTARGEPISLQEDNLLLLRKESKNNNHIFLIHDGTGEVESYAPFCNRLDIGFNYWGIRADRLENHTPLKETVKEIAQKYLQKMQTVQPPGSGPYFMAGWSVGGVIAFEMTRQLEKQHQDIAFLGLVDAPAPSRWLWWGTKSRMKLGKFNLTSEVNLLRRLVMEDEKINKKLKEIKNIDRFWPTITDYLENSGIDKKTIQRRMMRYGMQALPHFQRLNLRDSIYFFNMSRTLINAVRKYRPTGKINAPIHYFKARQTVEIKEKKWQKYTTATVNVYQIHGDHFSIFNKNLDDFVKVFSKALKQGTHNHVFHKNRTNNNRTPGKLG